MDKYIGKRLDGRYELKEIIGVGGMAYVYKAYDSIDDRTVAVKILKEEFLTNEEFIRRFKNESKAIAILSHPNIVKVLDVSFSDTLQYIVMEYIDGITLKEYLEQQKEVKWKEAVHFVTQILRALQHAHDKGIVHRDIKPQNIMLLPDGTIKVTDFGIARFSRQDIRVTAAENKAIGSVHYISPEQARGELTDEKADIYSVGVMLYEMLTGQVPFDADNAVSVAIMQLQSEPTMIHELNAQIPEGLEEITMKALQKDGGDRYQSAAEMLKDIDAFKRDPSIRFEYKYFVDDQPTRFVDTISEVKGETEEEEEPEEEEKKFPLIPVLAGIAGAFVLAAIIFVAITLGETLFGGKAGEKILMDDFLGEKYETIVNDPENIRKYEFVKNEGYSSEYPEGYVMSQDPKPNREVFLGSKVTLMVSLGEKMVDIPEVLPGEDLQNVKEKLEAAKFTYTIAYERSDEVAEGFVIRTEPGYGNKRSEGSKITIVVSELSDPVKVPNVLYLDKDQAIKELEKKGFSVDPANIVIVNTAPDSSTHYPAGTVILQEPAADEKYKPGDAVVKLQVASGYRDVPVTVKLPNTSTQIDLQVFIGGRLSSLPEFSTNLKNLLPNEAKTQKLTFTERVDSYAVTIKISVSGKSAYKDYVKFQIDGRTGAVSELLYSEFDDPNRKTTATTASSTSSTSTSGTTVPTSSDSTSGTTASTEPSGDEGDEDANTTSSDVSTDATEVGGNDPLV